MPLRLLFIVNDASYFLSHRLPIAIGARDQGYEVHVASRDSDAADRVRNHGLRFHPIPLHRGKISPLGEAKAFLAILRLLRSLRPQLVHTITTKPVLYGSIAARLADTPSLVAAIAGLGPLFTSKGPKFAILRTVATIIYRLALNHPNAIAIFQNKSDRQTILSATGIDPAKTILIRGSGVDLSKYAYTDEPTGMPVVLMASRLVRNKGPELFVDAARLIRSNGIAASFWLAGDPDPESHGTISQEILNKWRQEGIVSVLGHRSDIVGLLAKCSIFVLPSTYGEGLPKVLVEAAACGRPVITTDHPGCRDAIIPGKTGLLIRPNAEALASAIETLLSNPQNRQAMGRAGRRLAVEEYDIRNVVDTHLRTYDALTRAAATRPATVSS